MNSQRKRVTFIPVRWRNIVLVLCDVIKPGPETYIRARVVISTSIHFHVYTTEKKKMGRVQKWINKIVGFRIIFFFLPVSKFATSKIYDDDRVFFFLPRCTLYFSLTLTTLPPTLLCARATTTFIYLFFSSLKAYAYENVKSSPRL